ncbi:hypothetical protein [Plantactinospora sp. CA-290183]|uniref:hypothetical protein n=1 Tax=Plantactinospora sp. CA-290183 TaxID=3240006 RepID=UPI003D904070
MSLRARVLLFVALPMVVVVLFAAVGVVWWRWDSARQPDVTDDVPRMNEVIAAALVAAGDEAAVAMSGVYRAATCSLGPFRGGGQFTRTADLYTDPGSEDALISRIAAGLPSSYRVGRGGTAVSGNAAPLTASLGGVQLSVRHLGPGWVTARARTGCTGGAQGSDGAGDASGGAAGETIDRLLSTLGASAGEAYRHSVDCPTGGQVVTLAVLSRPTGSAALAERLRGSVPAGARQFTSPSNRISYRQGPVSVIVAASDDSTAVTARHTTMC